MRSELLDLVRTRFPSPLADAVLRLEHEEGEYERWIAIEGVLRTMLRLVAITALAARAQHGPHPEERTERVQGLLTTLLRRRGLSEGQWLELARLLLASWADAAQHHALPELVTAFARKKKGLDARLSALVSHRNRVAHDGRDDRESRGLQVEEALPDVEAVLEAFRPVADAYLLAVATHSDPPSGWRLQGPTPGDGRWLRVPLARPQPAGRVLWMEDPDGAPGEPRISLDPFVRFLPPEPEAAPAAFWFDGVRRREARFVGLPSGIDHTAREVLPTLRELAGFDDEVAEAPDQDEPFRGLQSFEPEHAALFFGRARLTDAVTNRVRIRPWVTVTGASGSGKSSLVAAGVVPALTDGASSELTWKVARLRPGAHPTQHLDAALSEVVGAEESTSEPDTLLGHLRRSDQQLLIVVDQAEELVTAGAPDAEIESFADRLRVLASDPSKRARVVVVVREDFFARLAEIDGWRGLYARDVVVVGAPTKDDLLDTLFGPARLAGYRFDPPALAQQMVEEVAGARTPLPLLQFAARAMWDRRDRVDRRLTTAAYDEMGGVSGALARHAETLWSELPEAEKAEARRMLLRLVTPEKTRIGRPRQDLLDTAEDVDGAARALDRLVQARLLLVREDSAEGELVELSHDTLIRAWGRLLDWLAESEDDHQLLAALSASAREWEGRERPKGLLWREEVLENLELYARTRGEDGLTPLEQAFLTACREQHALEVRSARRRAQLGWAVASAAVLLALAMAMVAWWAVETTLRGRGSELAAENAREDADHAGELAWSLAMLDAVRRTEPLDPRRLWYAREIGEQWRGKHLMYLYPDGIPFRERPCSGDVHVTPEGHVVYRAFGGTRAWAAGAELPGPSELPLEGAAFGGRAENEQYVAEAVEGGVEITERASGDVIARIPADLGRGDLLGLGMTDQALFVHRDGLLQRWDLARVRDTAAAAPPPPETLDRPGPWNRDEDPVQELKLLMAIQDAAWRASDYCIPSLFRERDHGLNARQARASEEACRARVKTDR